jgi:hypothetical protein
VIGIVLMMSLSFIIAEIPVQPFPIDEDPFGDITKTGEEIEKRTFISKGGAWNTWNWCKDDDSGVNYGKRGRIEAQYDNPDGKYLPFYDTRKKKVAWRDYCEEDSQGNKNLVVEFYCGRYRNSASDIYPHKITHRCRFGCNGGKCRNVLALPISDYPEEELVGDFNEDGCVDDLDRENFDDYWKWYKNGEEGSFGECVPSTSWFGGCWWPSKNQLREKYDLSEDEEIGLGDLVVLGNNFGCNVKGNDRNLVSECLKDLSKCEEISNPWVRKIVFDDSIARNSPGDCTNTECKLKAIALKKGKEMLEVGE